MDELDGMGCVEVLTARARPCSGAAPPPAEDARRRGGDRRLWGNGEERLGRGEESPGSQIRLPGSPRGFQLREPSTGAGHSGSSRGPFFLSSRALLRAVSAAHCDAQASQWACRSGCGARPFGGQGQVIFRAFALSVLSRPVSLSPLPKTNQSSPELPVSMSIWSTAPESSMTVPSLSQKPPFTSL
jgi:hypothetical protein